MTQPRRPILAGVLALVLGGCATAPVPGVNRAPDLRLAAGGLAVPGRNQAIDFGRAETGAVAAVGKLLGSSPAGRVTNTECGAGTVTTVSWDSGLDLMFQNNALRGWSADSATLTTVQGFRPGQTRADLSTAGVTGFEETSLGTEVQLADGIFALLDGPGPQARVSLIWAGVTCFFR